MPTNLPVISTQGRIVTNCKGIIEKQTGGVEVKNSSRVAGLAHLEGVTGQSRWMFRASETDFPKNQGLAPSRVWVEREIRMEGLKRHHILAGAESGADVSSEIVVAGGGKGMLGDSI